MNILMNAVQSIAGAGSVLVRTEQLPGSVRITIKDSGKGMTREQIAKAFDPAFGKREGRVSASLGLMITSQIVREHKGEIEIESRPGEGTTVVVGIPNRH
jgi:signal transduction histidine kinase